MKARRISLIGLLVVFIAGAVGFTLWYQQGIEPMPKGPTRYIRWERIDRMRNVLNALKDKKIVKNVDAARVYGWLNKKPGIVQTGTYELAPGMSLDEIFAELQKPVRQMVRIPETNWAAQTAKLLQKNLVARADDYLALVKQPEVFKDVVSFPLPKESLEGYLYPDTYDLPPLLGAKGTITRQLKAFEKKIWEPYHHPANLNDLVIKGSLVQLEAGRDDERPLIAGVIDNRIKQGMPLQIDAALLYSLQKWRRLMFSDYKNIDSPYNLYQHKGLPPGPICSPSARSFAAAKNPAMHKDLYYVAIPNGTSLFAETYDEHRKNIQKRDKLRKLAGKS